MANPRRNSYSYPNNITTTTSDSETPFQIQTQNQNHLSRISNLKHFLKKPHAFPFLLLIFVLLTWLFLRLQQSSSPHFPSVNNNNLQTSKSSKEDWKNANLVKFNSGSFPSTLTKDNRGWLLDPVTFALHSGINGGAVSCVSVHVGEIRPGTLRGNHRHHTCNETFVIWGAKTMFRLENNKMVDKGYAEVIIDRDEVAVVASPSGTAHALVNVDPLQSTFFLGCQDNMINYNTSTTDYNVWKDL